MVAIDRSLPEIVTILLTFDHLNINHKDNNGESALTHAANLRKSRNTIIW